MSTQSTKAINLNKVSALDGAKKAEPRPENAFTTREYAAHIGVGREQAGRRLLALEQKGLVKRASFQIQYGEGIARKSSGWVLIEQDKNVSTKKTRDSV